MMKKQTQAIHTKFQSPDAYGSLAMPVYHVAAYEFDDAQYMSDVFCGRVDAPDYSRITNPTVIFLEKKVAELTGASRVFALNSGMAAITSALITLAATGKNIVTSRHLFGNTYQFLAKTMPRFGVETRFVDLTNLAEVEAAVDDNTCCLFLEIITNPQMEVADIRALSAIAHAHGVALAADTTMIPFTEFSARDLGVDIELVSSTKYISGGATSLGGFIIDYGSSETFTRRMAKETLFQLGAYMTPHAAYMQTLGLETLDARYKVQSANALEVATRLQGVPGITKVTYPGLESNPFHELSRKQFGPTASAMLTIDLADRKACFDFINNLKLIHRATNLFDNRSLAIHPASTIFGPLSPDERKAMNVDDTTIRLSIGLEHPDDLVADILQALPKA